MKRLNDRGMELVIKLLHESHAASYNDPDETARDLVADALDILVGHAGPFLYEEYHPVKPAGPDPSPVPPDEDWDF